MKRVDRNQKGLRAAAALLGVLGLLLAGCGGGDRSGGAAGGGESARGASGIPVAELPDRRSSLGAEEILAAVRERFPASTYMSNAHLPEAGDYERWVASALTNRRRVRVGMPWIFSDGFSPLYVGIERGYFAAVGLDVEMVAGGPGRDHLQTLAAGQVELAIVADGLNLPVFAASRTSGDVVGVASFLKKNPVAYLSFDKTVAAGEASGRGSPTPEEFLDSTIGVLRGRTHYVEFLVREFGLDPARVRVRWTGATPDALVSGVVDHWAAWILDQPRLLEKSGHRNWRAFFFHDLGWQQYCDLVVVRRAMTTEEPDTVQRFLAALDRALADYFADPAAAAKITSRYARDMTLSPDDVLRRYAAEHELVRGDDGLPLLHMSETRWDDVAAMLVRYGLIEDRMFR